MVVVYGQIESLKRIRTTLNQKGITRFNSLGDLDRFKQNYEKERKELVEESKLKLQEELAYLRQEEKETKAVFDQVKKEFNTESELKIDPIRKKRQLIDNEQVNNLLLKVVNWIYLLILNLQIWNAEGRLNNQIKRKSYSLDLRLKELEKQIRQYEDKGEELVQLWASPKLNELEYQRNAIEELDPYIAGAIGENLVDKELRNLSDEFILFNDFNVTFNPPIYNRREGDRIYSIQADHLLISRAGVFVIETKNWSAKSVDNLDLRSPVDQVKRTGYALFTILNSDSGFNQFYLENHHWGDRMIPVKNLIVMINNKPSQNFKYVQVKALDELVRYVNYFEPIFSNNEVMRIAEFLNFMNR